MRVVPFKQVLHAVAFKLGLDPDQSNFLTNQAVPIGTYIDQWVQRVWTARDWPELVKTTVFVPGSTHIVPWKGSLPAFGGAQAIDIDRVLKVYLVDPGTTDAPVDTHYTLNEVGIHCGYEHGTNVWIQYIPAAPRFTSVTWRPDTTFAKEDITYSAQTGHVYKSKVNGNQGHDPALSFAIVHQPPPAPTTVQPPIQLPTELTQNLTPFKSGVPAQSKVMDLKLAIATSTVPIANPPVAGSGFVINVADAAGGFLAAFSHTNDGIETLDTITTLIANALVGQLPPSFVITTDLTNFVVRLEDASDFQLLNEYYTVGSKGYKLEVTQIAAYTPAVAPTAGDQQVIRVTLTDADVTHGAVYTLNFKDVAGGDHSIEYEAVDGDGNDEILSALVALVPVAAVSDTFFSGVYSSLDATSDSADFGTTTKISLNAQMVLPGSPWWEVVPFPEVLANQVERGAFADLLKEWGQSDKGMAEEAVVPTEMQSSSDSFESTPNPPLTTQQRALSRYKI